MFLTPDELERLTGYQKPSAQARWLEEVRLPFLKGGDGKLKVLRLAVEQRLGAPVDKAKKREPQLRLEGLAKGTGSNRCGRSEQT